ncbi:MAG: DUF1294 domain-containing protein [Bacillota bacterium]|nr:DUF1294 domain-containing protein [Bacillota bacterium]
MKYLAAYIVLINITGFIIMYKDKQYARRHQWRIKESTIFITALALGSLGVFTGMRVFRHKTKHWKFVIFIPLILIAQVALLYRFLFMQG